MYVERGNMKYCEPVNQQEPIIDTGVVHAPQNINYKIEYMMFPETRFEMFICI